MCYNKAVIQRMRHTLPEPRQRNSIRQWRKTVFSESMQQNSKYNDRMEQLLL